MPEPCVCLCWGGCSQAAGLCPDHAPPPVQRQRLRELLIRQQIQRNNLRQEKESAAAAAGSTPTAWGPDTSSQAFEQLSRGMAPYQPVQVQLGADGRVGTGVWCRAVGEGRPCWGSLGENP